MPIYLIAKISHTVMNICCFGYNISVNVFVGAVCGYYDYYMSLSWF